MAKKPTSEMTPEQLEREREYQRQYYAENKKTLGKKRKELRDSNPKIKAEYLERSKRNYWVRVRPKRSAELAALYTEAPALADIAPRGTAVVEGRKRTFYSLKALGELLVRSPDTLLDWEKRGVIPPPKYSQAHFDKPLSKGNPKFYTKEEMLAYEQHRDLLALPSRSLADSIFAKTIHEALAGV